LGFEGMNVDNYKWKGEEYDLRSVGKPKFLFKNTRLFDFLDISCFELLIYSELKITNKNKIDTIKS
jgi:hypothetical protein